MTPTTLLNDHQNLLRWTAWKVSRAFLVEFEEALSQSYLIFSKALLKFDESRGVKFSTFLVAQLRTMFTERGTYAINFRKKMVTGQYDEVLSTVCVDFPRMPEFQMLVESDLTMDAQMLLSYILDTGEKWSLKDLQPTCKEVFGWCAKKTIDCFHEIKAFWREYDSSYYAL